MGKSALAVIVLLSGLLFVSCEKGMRDTEGKPLQIGEQYVMTKAGLEHAPMPRDTDGNRLEAGREYIMTSEGLTVKPYLEDNAGNKVQIGSDYMMTEEGLKLVAKRDIRGRVRDGSGRFVGGITVSIAHSDHKVQSDADGNFSLPFIEGSVRIGVGMRGLPEWCKVENLENSALSREAYPSGWDIGMVELPCTLVEAGDGRSRWSTANGRYVDNGDGTVTDTESGLMWEAIAQEQNLAWDAAREYVEKLNLAGFSDWRLPTPREVGMLFDADIACGWRGLTVIRGVVSVWTSEQSDPASAVVYNLCTGRARKSSGLDEGVGINPGVVAVRHAAK